MKDMVLFNSIVAEGALFFLHCLCIAQITGDHGQEDGTCPQENHFLLNAQDIPIHTLPTAANDIRAQRTVPVHLYLEKSIVLL